MKDKRFEITVTSYAGTAVYELSAKSVKHARTLAVIDAKKNGVYVQGVRALGDARNAQ